MKLSQTAEIRPAESYKIQSEMLGMKVDLLDPKDLVSTIIDRSKSSHAGYVCVTNVHQCMLTYDEPDFRAIVNGSDLAVPDSTVLRKAVAWRHRLQTPHSLKGADLMLELCAAAARERVPIALIGGRDDEILAKLKAELLRRWPTLQIVFAYSPPFRAPTPQEVLDLAAGINASGAQLVFVGLGCPKQERWMAQYKPLISAMMIGVGAAFDFNAGLVRPSPDWVHRAGLEWLWRLVSEPRRLGRRYLTTSPRFLWLLVRNRQPAR